MGEAGLGRGKLRTEAPVNGGRNYNGQPEQREGGGLGEGPQHPPQLPRPALGKGVKRWSDLHGDMQRPAEMTGPPNGKSGR